jgi:benzoyl-CoA reductase subunit C
MAEKVAAKGLARAKEIYQNRDKRVRELKAEGKKVMGYLCIYPPLEIVTALDFVPFRVVGDMNEAITKADAYVPTIICPFLRSTFDLALKERYDFLDGFAGSHVCDCAEKMCHLWDYYLSPSYYFFIDYPHVVHRASFDSVRVWLDAFKSTLEKHTGKELTAERLKQEIKSHNQQRALVRELYGLKKQDPPLLSGTETLQIVIALMSIPLEEGSELLREVIKEVKERKDGPQKQAARLLVWGSPLDDIGLIEMIESVGANVVMDDTCIGSRHYWPDVELTPDPMDGIVSRYLNDLKCPRTFRETTESYKKDLEDRFGYVKDYAREWNVNGVIFQSVKYCDTHGYELPAIKDYFDDLGIPNMYLEHEYTKVALAPLRTRVQAFLEMIG